MKKILWGVCLFFLLMTLYGCETASQLDIAQGYGAGLKLVHLSAGSGDGLERIGEFREVLREAEPLDKDPALFAYYPDFLVEIRTPEEEVCAVVDINGEFVDFYYTGQEDRLYRAGISAEDFLTLVHTS